MLQRLALGTEGRITQARAARFLRRAVTEASTAVAAKTVTPIATPWSIRIARTPAVLAVAGAPTASGWHGCVLLHTWAVVTPHGDHGPRRLGRRYRRCGWGA